MIANPIGHLIGYPTHYPKGYPNRPRIARPGPARIGPSRPQLTTRGEPFTTSSSYVTREVVQPRAGRPRDAMVSATRLNDRPDLDTIEHLDFDPVVPCEAKVRGSLHSGPADVLIVGQCPGCAAVKFHLRRYGMCWRHWRKAKSVGLTCKACGHKDVMAGGFFRIVEVLR